MRIVFDNALQVSAHDEADVADALPRDHPNPVAEAVADAAVTSGVARGERGARAHEQRRRPRGLSGSVRRTTTDGAGGRISYGHSMFKTIVTGSDGQRGRGAASLAYVIAHATGARLLLVGVGYGLPLPLFETDAQMHDALEQGLRGVRDELAPDALTQVAVDISPAHALRRIAKSEHADLVVVGSRHRGQLQRLTSRDSAMQVLHGAPCAVAVAPDHLPVCRSLTEIGVGLDASPESAVALTLALELARLSGANVRLLAVASEVYAGSANIFAGASYADSYPEIIDARLHSARSAIDRALEQCAGVPGSGDVQLGDAATELTALSADCDLLVLGSRHWGPVRRLALGSTSEQVIRHAACPVLVPPRSAATEHDAPQRPEDATVIL